MTSQDFLEWMAAVGATKAIQIVEILGVGRNQAQRWVNDANAGNEIQIKKATALAMTAAANNLTAWGTTKGK